MWEAKPVHEGQHATQRYSSGQQIGAITPTVRSCMETERQRAHRPRIVIGVVVSHRSQASLSPILTVPANHAKL